MRGDSLVMPPNLTAYCGRAAVWWRYWCADRDRISPVGDSAATGSG